VKLAGAAITSRSHGSMVGSPDEHPLLAELRVRPDDLTVQRAARLLLLLQVASLVKVKRPLDLERLSYYDFFAANPFALFEPDDSEAKEILLAGFSSYDLSYQSSGHRFITRRARLQADLAFLVARALVAAGAGEKRVVYALTEDGITMAKQLASLYAQAYRSSARHVVARLDRLSDAALAREARSRLEATGQLIDLYTGEP